MPQFATSASTCMSYESAAANAFQGEARSVVIDADADPPEIVSDVVHAVGNRSARLRVHEVVQQHACRILRGTVFAAAILKFADQFLLLGLDRKHGVARAQTRAQLRTANESSFGQLALREQPAFSRAYAAEAPRPAAVPGGHAETGRFVVAAWRAPALAGCIGWQT